MPRTSLAYKKSKEFGKGSTGVQTSRDYHISGLFLVNPTLKLTASLLCKKLQWFWIKNWITKQKKYFLPTLFKTWLALKEGEALLFVFVINLNKLGHLYCRELHASRGNPVTLFSHKGYFLDAALSEKRLGNHRFVLVTWEVIADAFA